MLKDGRTVATNLPVEQVSTAEVISLMTGNSYTLTTADETVPAVGPRSDVDVELSTLRPPQGTEHPRWRVLAVEPLRLLVGPGHRLSGTDEVALSQVADEPFGRIRLGATTGGSLAADFSVRLDATTLASKHTRLTPATIHAVRARRSNSRARSRSQPAASA